MYLLQKGEGFVCEAAQGARLPPHASQACRAGEKQAHHRHQTVLHIPLGLM